MSRVRHLISASFHGLHRKWPWAIGLGALVWVLIRSGTNPRRLAYPCQRAALPVAVGWLVSVAAFLAGSWLLMRFIRVSALAVLILGVVWFTGASPDRPLAQPPTRSLPTWEVDDPVSRVFVMDEIPSTVGSLASGGQSIPDAYLADPAIDTLLMMMETEDIYLHRTDEHPQGIVGPDNVVIIKGNYQWSGRNGTHTDRVKGLIWQILRHPDGFTGEIIVCDNVQDLGSGIDEEDNNSEDRDQTILDVVDTFHAKGHPVYVLDWSIYWEVVATEYSEGDYGDGYIYEEHTKISYPKFCSPSGDYFISLRHGIWDPAAAKYYADRLCIINFPVLKAHMSAGSTAAVKNWIGVLTTGFKEERYGGKNPMHGTYLFGSHALVARVMEVTYPRLSILDATWVNGYGPMGHDWVVEARMLMGSTDPVALSWYATKFALTPIARFPVDTNPDNPAGRYHPILSNWTTYLVDVAGMPCTKDSLEISVFDRSVLDETVVNGGPGPPGRIVLDQNYPNPMNPSTSVRFSLNAPGQVHLSLYDAGGRRVRLLAERAFESGPSEVAWDGRDDDGRRVSSGVYMLLAECDSSIDSRKVVIVE